jgi:succinate dehydrogenase hydrophobic anchor subunit
MLGKSRVPGWHWVMQRVSALVLTVGLLGHFFVLHYTRLVGPRCLPAPESTASRFIRSPGFWMLFDGLLLAAGLYHALNGLYNIISDYNPKPCTRRTLAWVLWIGGAGAFMLGLLLLGKFVGFANSELVAGFPLPGGTE